MKVAEKDLQMANRNMELVFEFERYLLEHPEFQEQIPAEAVICFQLEGDSAFNEWSRKLGQERAAREGKPLILVKIGRLGPVRSRIENLEFVRQS